MSAHTTERVALIGKGCPMFVRHIGNAVERYVSNIHDSTVPTSRPSDEYLNEVTYRFQGSIVEVKTNRPRIRMPDALWEGRSIRGEITEFSCKSRVRMMKMLARLNWKEQKPIFLTLTYPGEFPNARTAKRHLRAFLKRIWHVTQTLTSAIWRLEFQKRGAPHFHIIVFGLPFIHYEVIQQLWCQVIKSEERVFTRIEMLRSARQAMYYISKYMAKVEQSSFKSAVGDSGFIHVPYLAAGRFWGVENRKLMPFAEEMIMLITDAWAAFDSLKRAARHKFAQINRKNRTGWFLFVNDPEQWREYLLYLLFDTLT